MYKNRHQYIYVYLFSATPQRKTPTSFTGDMMISNYLYHKILVNIESKKILVNACKFSNMGLREPCNILSMTRAFYHHPSNTFLLTKKMYV